MAQRRTTTRKAAAKKKPDVVRPEVVDVTFDGPQAKGAGLRTWNLVAAGVFAVQAVLLWIISTGHALPVSLNYLTTDPLQTAAQGKTVLTPAAHQWFTLNILYLVVLSLFVAAIVHLLVATYYRPQYETGLERGTHPLRWWGYAVSESLLLVTVGLLVGVQDVTVLLALVSLSVTKNLLLWMVERIDIGTPIHQKLGLVLAGLAGVVSLAVVALYLFSGTVYGDGTPGYLYGLFATGLVGFGLLGLNAVLHHRGNGRWANYVYTERVYLVLGLVVASALAWQIFAGALTS